MHVLTENKQATKELLAQATHQMSCKQYVPLRNQLQATQHLNGVLRSTGRKIAISSLRPERVFAEEKTSGRSFRAIEEI